MFQEDFTEFLDIDGGFASSVEVIPLEGDKYVVTGIFSSEYVDIDEGFAAVSGNNPVFECAEEDVADINYKEYRIKGIRPDGTGWVTLVLEKQL